MIPREKWEASVVLFWYDTLPSKYSVFALAPNAPREEVGLDWSKSSAPLRTSYVAVSVKSTREVEARLWSVLFVAKGQTTAGWVLDHEFVWELGRCEGSLHRFMCGTSDIGVSELLDMIQPDTLCFPCV
jgi:hypothetical protein